MVVLRRKEKEGRCAEVTQLEVTQKGSHGEGDIGAES